MGMKTSRVNLFLAAAAVLLFVPLFLLRGAGPLDFWWRMSGALVLLIGTGAALDRDYLPLLRADFRNNSGRKFFLGAISAVFLYAVFFAGNAAARALFSFAENGISSVYEFREGASTLRIGLLLAFVIGPGEELFWRGFLQRKWADRLGPGRGFAAATALYMAVHLGSGNPMLVLAAAVCGVFWGLLYRRTGSVLLCAASHTLWDLAVFLFFPFT
jgi:hypothetical protein